MTNEQYGIVSGVKPLITIMCDGCDKPVPCYSQQNLPEHGLVLDFARIDYYGGFSDFLGDDGSKFRLCHDCSLRLVLALPAIAEKLPKGLHPCDLDKPCCDYAWKLVDKQVYLATNGEWVLGD